jgi:hypothetical protein
VTVSLGALVVVACGSDTTRAAPSPYASTLLAVCGAAALARSGDATAARTTFLDRAHQGVHELAAATTPHDRPAAGRMLERKEQVEADLSTSAPAATLAGDLDRLADAVATAIAASGGAHPGTCDRATP